MAESCIVCLGDLRVHIEADPPPEVPEHVAQDPSLGGKGESKRACAKSLDEDEESIAHLLPCKHDLHNACLKPWVERANSCPICRAKFNMVELSRAVGGPVEDSYAVQDKLQEPELDPAMIVEDELFAVETWEPCLLCGTADDTHEYMYCDGCDKAAHVFCAGFEDSPDVWYCESCLGDLEEDTGVPGMARATRRQSRRRARFAGPHGRRPRENDAIWARVWQEVSRQLDLDLDFPFDNEGSDDRTPAQQRELVHWQRRLGVARQQGAATDRLRDIATGRVGQRIRAAPPEPESQEEIMAWNAFDKARVSHEEPGPSRRRKRKATASPASPHEQEQAQQQLKRPRTRATRPVAIHSIAEVSNAAAQANEDRSTFLSSLLKDVEKIPPSAGSPSGSDQFAGQWSPRNSSPARSPSSSNPGTPRALSPMPQQMPLSPPLSSNMIPKTQQLTTFSPFSPAVHSQDYNNTMHHRGRQRSPPRERRASDDSRRGRAASGSPSRNLSLSTKEEIQRMVKLALAPRYREKEINKDQYTDVNRDVSRKMYEFIGDACALTDQAEREHWQSVAEDEVKQAIAQLHFGSHDELV